jgi:hypothetical protein
MSPKELRKFLDGFALDGNPRHMSVGKVEAMRGEIYRKLRLACTYISEQPAVLGEDGVSRKPFQGIAENIKEILAANLDLQLAEHLNKLRGSLAHI